jgi:lysophospholipase
MRWHLLFLLAAFLPTAPNSSAICETNYEKTYKRLIVPLVKSARKVTFPSADGIRELSGVLLLHPNARGIVVVLNGRSESWLKYGELFYDLYREGYSVASYDHRGQGLSPRLVAGNAQTGHVDDFGLYGRDLNSFMNHVVLPTKNAPIYLLAHSMGATVALEYLEHYAPQAPPLKAAVLTAPMLRINTSPYPEPLARMIVEIFHLLGFGRHYVIGEHDYDPSEPFCKNRITSSKERWKMSNLILKEHPEAVTGGPSNDWVLQSLEHTACVRRNESHVRTKILILQAGKDQLVINKDENEASKVIPNSRLIKFPDSKHELLMESDPIRERVMSEILDFFAN